MLPVWKLIGFFIYVTLYFQVLDVYTVWPAETLQSVFFKLMPIVHLVFITVSTSLDEDLNLKSPKYQWNIVLGLIASAIGDYCMIYPSYLYPGLISFSVAHMFYIRAFGLGPLGSGPMAASFAVAAVAAYFFLVHMLPLPLKIFGTIYIVVTWTMAWRSMVVLHHERSFDSFLACMGAFLFLVSDAMITVDMFYGSFNGAPFWAMVTYYGAQLGIALSASNTHSSSAVHKQD